MFALVEDSDLRLLDQVAGKPVAAGVGVVAALPMAGRGPESGSGSRSAAVSRRGRDVGKVGVCVGELLPLGRCPAPTRAQAQSAWSWPVRRRLRNRPGRDRGDLQTPGTSTEPSSEHLDPRMQVNQPASPRGKLRHRQNVYLWGLMAHPVPTGALGLITWELARRCLTWFFGPDLLSSSEATEGELS